MASRRYRSKDFSPWFNSQVPCLDFDAFFKMFSFVSCRHYKCQRTIFFLRILITINLLFFKDINRLSKKLFLNGRLKSRESHNCCCNILNSFKTFRHFWRYHAVQFVSSYMMYLPNRWLTAVKLRKREMAEFLFSGFWSRSVC